MLPQPTTTTPNHPAPRCRICGGAVDRGWTCGNREHRGDMARCLICLTAAVMATFVWPPRGK